MVSETAPVKLFYSYSHKDEALRAELEKHLSILRRQGVITEWHDRKITAGDDWAGKIDEHLDSAQVVLLLISADFLASDYCYEKEMELALKRHEEGEVRVIPVVLRSVDWQGAPFGTLQALPKDAKPVVTWDDRDEAFTNIAQGIRSAVGQVTKSARRRATSDVVELLKKFELRPKKYSGKEFIADVKIEDSISSVTTEESEALSLTLGDAIDRRFIISSAMQHSDRLYAEGEVADWLESAESGTYRVRIRLLFGTHEETLWGEDGPSTKEHATTGFKLMEVIETQEEQAASG